MLSYNLYMSRKEAGYTLVELMVSILVLSMIALAAFQLLMALLNSSVLSKRQAVAYTLANNQMEYLKELPYDRLAVAGGAIPATVTIPASFNSTINGDMYTVKTAIVYSDDAYDGCGSYPNQELKLLYCRNYPPPTGAPNTDTNPKDTKNVTVTVTDRNNKRLAFLDTNVAARVAETASNTGALFVRIVDETGSPISGATVNATNSTTSPSVNVSDTSDSNGTVIFYGLPPDSSNFDYFVSASLSNHSTLATLAPAGSLQPSYSSVNLLAQNSALVTLKLLPMNNNSLIIETTDVNGSALGNVKTYVKGGYKRYTNISDTSYYYDTLRGSDTRPTTDAGGLAALSALVPGDYIFCGDLGATSCQIGGTTYYLAAAIPYGGINPLNPVSVPTYLASNPPATTYDFGGNSFMQKVRLMMTTNSNYPRITSLNPYNANLSTDNMSSINFSLKGANLPCNASPASCSTVVRLIQGANTFTASCTGNAAGLQVDCNVNLSSAVAGDLQLQVVANGNTLTLPTTPKGGFSVTP